jgi:hypothetical protein
MSAGSSVNGTSRRYKYVATAAQTTFTGVDANGATMAYDPGYLDVYLNGSRLDASDYTATSGSSIVLGVAASVNDELNIVCFGTFAVAAHVLKSGDTMTGQLTVPNLVSTNGSTIQGLTVGRGAGSVATNTAVGASALAANTSGATNTAVGNVALQANTTGSGNGALGYFSLYSNTTGASNTALGYASLANNTTASANTAVGYQAGYNNTTGTQNTILGYQAGYSVTTNSYNTFVGASAGSATTGANNTFIGINAGYNVTSGAKNTIIGGYNGNQGGLDIRTSSNVIVLSDGDGSPRGWFNGSTFYVGLPASSLSALGWTLNVGTNGGGACRYTQTNNEFFTWDNYNGAGTATMDFRWNNGSVGAIRVTSTGVTYYSASDYRLKTVHSTVSDATERLRQIPIYRLNFNSNPDEVLDSFFAHEVQQQAPYAVHGEKDATLDVGDIRNAEGKIIKASCRQPETLPEDQTWTYTQTVGQWQQVDPAKLVPLVMASLQEAWDVIDQFKAEIDILKGQA